MPEHDDVLRVVQIKEQRPLAIDIDRVALLVIDVQADFVDGRYGFGRTFEAIMPGITTGYFQRVRDRVLPNIRSLQAQFRALGLPIFYTGTGTPSGTGKDLALWLREFDELGSHVLGERVWPAPSDDAWQICEDIEPMPGEPVLNKTAADPTICTSLLHSLRCRGIEQVIVTGLTTDVCVASTARACADQGLQTIIASDACTTLSEVLHDASLTIFSLAFGRVKTAAEIVSAIVHGGNKAESAAT